MIARDLKSKSNCNTFFSRESARMDANWAMDSGIGRDLKSKSNCKTFDTEVAEAPEAPEAQEELKDLIIG